MIGAWLLILVVWPASWWVAIWADRHAPLSEALFGAFVLLWFPVLAVAVWSRRDELSRR